MDVNNTCAHCAAPIVDPTTQVIHASQAFCCANCAAAMEQQGGGSDPHAAVRENDLRCARCECPIVNEDVAAWEEDRVYCCANCEQAARAAKAA